ncbi:MAG: hypothetical protein WD794_02480 [Mycobacteriales bacterium]
MAGQRGRGEGAATTAINTKNIQSLPADGVLVITTESSTHVIDFSARTLVRAPDTGGGGAHVRVSALRRDHVPLTLLGLGPLRHGEPAVLMLQVVPGRLTVRQTTRVVDVRWAVPPSAPVPADLALSVAGGPETALSPALAQTRDWLEGRVDSTPHHFGPPCPETLPLLQALVELNDASILTVCSQPSVSSGRLRQRAYLDMITSASRAARLTAVLSAQRLLVDHWPLSQVPAGRGPVPVTLTDGQPSTWSMLPVEPSDVRPDFAQGFQQAHREAFPPLAYALGRAHALVVVEPSWEPSDRLWQAVVQGAKQVQP